MSAWVIGLTGGIGSGKSTVAKMFERLGAGCIDCDAIAHELTAPGQPAVAAIAQAFGPGYVDPGKRLNRGALRQLVFADSGARATLEAILHPLIGNRVRDELQARREPYVLLAVPLLIETGALRNSMQRILVVDCDEALQIARTVERSALSADEVEAIIASQASRAERLQAADDVISNDGSEADLQQQVQTLHVRYCDFARRAVEPPRRNL